VPARDTRPSVPRIRDATVELAVLRWGSSLIPPTDVEALDAQGRTDRLGRRTEVDVVRRVRLQLVAGVRAGLDAPVDGVDRLPIERRVPVEQRAEDRNVEASRGQGVVETAQATAVYGFQAQMRQRRDGIARQQDVAQLEQRNGTTIEAIMQSRAKRA
jgi:hypothetical protein